MHKANSENFLALSQHLSGLWTLDALMEYAVNAALHLADAERGIVRFTLQEPPRAIYAELHARPGRPDQKLHPLSDTLIDHAIRTRAPQIACRTRSGMAAPLIANGELFGVILVEKRELLTGFTDTQFMELGVFVHQAAATIWNTALNEEIDFSITGYASALNEQISDLARLWMQSDEADQTRRVLLAQAIHDLCTPLSITILGLRVLEDDRLGKLTPRQKQRVFAALSSAEQAFSLATEIIALVRSGTGHPQRETPHEMSIHCTDCIPT